MQALGILKILVWRIDKEMVCFDLFGNKYIVSEEYKACIFRSDMWGDSNKRNFKIPYKKRPCFHKVFFYIHWNCTPNTPKQSQGIPSA